MASTGKINLIKEFSENQKENDVIVLTTFKFDAPFFDIYLFNRLLDYNSSAEIFILMDGNEYLNNYDLFTKHTGRAYHLIPVFPKKGVFHPKLSLFYSGSESKITAYVGSCNVTLAGFTANAEIVTKIDSKLNPVDANVVEAVNYYKTMVDKGLILNVKFSKAINEISEKITNQQENNEVTIIHNLEQPILNQTLKKINPPEDVLMLAPFWSPNTRVLEEINSKQSLKKAEILIQENNHNLTDPKKYQEYCNNNNISLNFKHAKFEKNRTFHSKILCFNKQNTALLGSSNMTESALLKTVEGGNFEVSVLLKKKVDELIKEIKTQEIKDITKIVGKTIEYEAKKQGNMILFDVDFDITQILTVTLQKDAPETSIKIIFEDGSEEQHNLNNTNKLSIHCEKIPFEIIVTQGDKSSRRRVFYDANYIYKKISKGSISLTEINKKITQDFKINALDLLRVLSGINTTIDKEKSQERSSESKKEPGTEKRFSLPSREIDSYHNRRIINNFVDLYKIMSSKREEEREIQESGELDESDQPKASAPIQRIFDEDKERKRICQKILNSINGLLIFKASLNENPENEMLSSIPLMAQAIIKILSPIYIDDELLETFREDVNENLENIKIKEHEFEIRKNLFNSLTLFNYFFDVWMHYDCLSELISITELIDETILTESLEQIRGHIEVLRQENCNEEEMLQHMGFLASYIPDSSTMEEDIIESLKRIKSLKDDKLWTFVQAYLENFISMWSISSSLKEEMLNEIKKYPDNKKKIIEEMLKDK